ncbi:NACHT domain-containing protein [Kribbella sp. NPDC004875]|uniref:NACHT domain-containing protein n=1 Tax=Kribbella sp. NPDC004875 TaxID=3364107 RepID=UPI0036C1C8FF
MAVSPYTFKGALAVLDIDDRSRTALERFFGTAIFAGAGAAALAGGPVAGLTAAAWLSLVDPKNEAVSLLDGLVNTVSKRLRGTRAKNQLDLVVAAHTITAVSSFFDALPQVTGPAHRDLALTDRERSRLLEVPGTDRDDLFEVAVPMSSPELGLTENIERNLKPYYERLARRCVDFFSGLEAWSRDPAPPAGVRDAIVARAVQLYRSRMLELSPSAPFGLWVTLNEFAATRAEIRAQGDLQAAALGELRTMLTMVMPGFPTGRNSYREKLALAAREVLDEPLLRSRTQAIASPTVRDGFVEPSFHHAIADDSSRPSDEDWWSAQPEHTSLVEYLASYLASPDGARRPLLLLGHPGAGKSLLTEVLAAQLPEDAFAVVRVPLRSVNPDDDLTLQINKELQRTLQRPNADLDELRQECGACETCGEPETCPHRCHLVVLLDGFDELVQATGVTQSAYLSKIESFQKRARTLGAPTSVIITSRTLVADRAEIAAGTPMIKLCEFDESRIAQWLTAWNAAHGDIAGFAPLQVGEMTASHEIRELTAQPLLLLMLAVYLAELGTSELGSAELTRSELYQRIMDRFIYRQITEKTALDRPENEQQLLQRQLRRRLQYAAIGMFNRGRQHITDNELNADLAALEPRPAEPAAALQPLTAGDRVLGEFMFVHNARADREQRNAYEFLHATFGEFLVAELVLELLLHLMRHRDLEATALVPQPNGLDDDLLRRLLSHQPLTTRAPVTTFVTELVDRLQPSERQSLLATISEILRRELTRPDNGDPLYHPLPYDPVRRRACYSANLTLLRVSLDSHPTPLELVVGPGNIAGWIRMVRLWHAGLDEATWITVVRVLAFEATDPPVALARARLTYTLDLTIDPPLKEAELLGDYQLKAELVVGSAATRVPNEAWRPSDFAAMDQIATIHFLGTGVPQFDSLLPYDASWFGALLTLLTQASVINFNVKRAIIFLLSRSAVSLPFDHVKGLLAHVLPALPDGYEVELASVAACHPALLHETPGLREYLLEAGLDRVTTVVALLWRAEGRAAEPERRELSDLRWEIDLSAVRSMPFECGHVYFAPEFLTYLRVEQPPHWIDRDGVPQIFESLEGMYLARIAPEDALYVAETWPDDATDFAVGYLSSRGIPVQEGADAVEVLRGR